jgi:hypothetical protein
MPQLNPRKQKVLLVTLGPLLAQHTYPRTTTRQQDDLTLLNGSIAAAATLLCPDSDPKPQPTQGGERISLNYLKRISQPECIWRFR